MNYRYNIFEKIPEYDEMIKKSIEIFQLHLKNYLKKDKFGDNMTNILNGNDNIIKLIEKKLNIFLKKTL